jgi:hypothetical protein
VSQNVRQWWGLTCEQRKVQKNILEISHHESGFGVLRVISQPIENILRYQKQRRMFLFSCICPLFSGQLLFELEIR